MNDAVNPLAEFVGPSFYSHQTLLEWLELSSEEIDEMIRSHRLLACPSREGDLFYPVWQFTSAGKLLPGLAEVLEALASGTNEPWTWGVWLKARIDDLGGISAAQWLEEGRDKEIILRSARKDAYRWAH
jgi:hypothetical protein